MIPAKNMASRKRLTRRKFLQTAAAAAATPYLASCTGGPPSPFRCLTPQEARTAEAVCETIIPADQDAAGVAWPGASWAGVVHYIDRQLSGPYQDHRPSYRLGLAGVDEASMALGGKPFTDLAPEDRVKILAALEKNEAPGETWKKIPASQFFALIVDHTLQGFYGDPRHGGNRDGISWKMLAIPYPPIRGQRRSRFGGARQD